MTTSLMIYNFVLTLVLQFFITMIYFYDAPTPSGVFEEFLAIPAAEGNVSTRTLSDFVQSLAPQPEFNGPR
jgi:hypothetical protein